ncbi:voltage-dependent calcium channel gamma-1 subunit-like [Hypomesus transpacificus]|uniref:voltage-dependent calcium channel gamma-1 subunit-like n=1 Tax=Hypomesus transpacificus TaxID=137520 RepID=UPI001F076585|nr:voltage-dependent calcium channel gamma-1 subunit-like [Hypomesus transpacificus]
MLKRTKVKIAIFVLVVGMASMFTAVVTDHWAVLSPKVESVNTTCEAAHFGLWRLCKKLIYMSEENYKGKGCGPISLPGVENCTYFKHFTPGEEAEIFEVKTQKEYNISAAAISIFSLAFMILGTLCLVGSFMGKGRDYLLKPAGMFFAFAGLCSIISVEVMRQSVKRMIESEDTIWIEYSYAWSFACACAGFVLLFLTGIALLLLSMPHMPQNPWETCMDAEPEQVE